MAPAADGAVLCVDAGTTLIKSVVFDNAGTELLVRRRPTTLSHPAPGRSEQDMSAVLEAVIDTIAAAAHASPIPIRHVAITAQGDGAWMVDDHHRPAHPAVLWNDGRAVDVIDQWNTDGVLNEAFTVNGSISNLGLPNAILAWFHQHDPDTLDQVQQVLTCGSWIFASLTDVWGLHPSDASAPWLDIHTGHLSDQLLNLYGLLDDRTRIPEILQGEALTQPLTSLAAHRTGLPVGTPVTLAAYDVVATAVGSGVTVPGAAFTILGTTLCTGVPQNTPDTTGTPAGLTLLSNEPGSYRVFPTLAGTGVIEWMAQLLGVTDAAALCSLASQSPSQTSQVRVLPYFSPAGERAPFLDPTIRGSIDGLSFDTTPADLARATLEGLAHVIRDCLTATNTSPDTVTVTGGGAASDVWCQIIADVTGTRTVRPSGTQIGARGAYLSARVASGDFTTLTHAAAATPTSGDSFSPDDRTRCLYQDRHNAFIAARHARVTS